MQCSLYNFVQDIFIFLFQNVILGVLEFFLLIGPSSRHWPPSHEENCTPYFKERENYRIYHSSIQHENTTPYMFVVDSAQMHSNTLIQCQINKEKVPSGLHMAFMLVEHEVPSYMITPPPLSPSTVKRWASLSPSWCNFQSHKSFGFLDLKTEYVSFPKLVKIITLSCLISVLNLALLVLNATKYELL